MTEDETPRSTVVFLVTVLVLVFVLAGLEVYGKLTRGDAGTISVYSRHRWWLRALILAAILLAAAWWTLHSAPA